MVSSDAEFSRVTRIRVYMASTPDYLDEKPDVQRGNEPGNGVCEPFEPWRIHELAHLELLRGEPHEGEHRERKLHAEDDLAQDEQLGRPALAVVAGDDHRGDDGDTAGDQAPEPRPEPDIE